MTDMIRMARGALLALGASLLLTGCLFAPGKFGSELTLLRDGSFTYSYEGEIAFFPLTDMAAQMGMDGASAIEGEFTAYCYTEDTFEERECTEEEKAEQTASWEQLKVESAERKKTEAEQMKRMMGVDPNDPEAGNKLAAQLERQAGWDKVTYRGDGIFEVSYRIQGRTTHDFAFPTVEGMSGLSPFVAVTLRDGGKVRIDAPLFSGSSGDGAGMGMMGMMMMVGGGTNSDMPEFAMADGTFTIITDGEILANNTDEGAETGSDGRKRLSWRVETSLAAAPTALIGF